MASSAKRPAFQIALVAVLVCVLVLLALLQYHWSVAVSRAEQSRIEASLHTSVTQFRREFHRELAQACAVFHREPGTGGGDFRAGYAERYQEWVRTAPHPDLVAHVYVWQSGPEAESQLLLLNASDNQFHPAVWPASLAGLRSRIEPPERESAPREPGQPPAPDMRMGPEMRMFAWTLDSQIPALIHAVNPGPGRRWRRQELRPEPPPEPPRATGFVILELNRAAVEQQLADLAQRFFSGPDGMVYNVAVLNRGGTLYRSDSQLTEASLTPPDAGVPLLPATPVENHMLTGEPAGAPPAARGPMHTHFAMILPAPGSDPWWLLVRHRGGSLKAVVAADRNRHLLLSFGVLLLLAASMALVLISSQRARRLAHLQMEFVAGVSHELRTPLAVICSAADNLAEGFVGSKEQVREYGSVIRNEGRRLADMIEQILLFAAGQSGRHSGELQPTQVSEAIAGAIAAVAALPEAADFTVERQIDPDLPLVEANAAALKRCLQNLIVNALKYGGDTRWARVRAASTARGGTPLVRITVEDRGMGIDPADLPHIFEPFYRGKAAVAAQIHGAGLGLNLARETALRMGGELTVSSEAGRGSTFTLELPALAGTSEALPRSA